MFIFGCCTFPLRTSTPIDDIWPPSISSGRISNSEWNIPGAVNLFLDNWSNLYNHLLAIVNWGICVVSERDQKPVGTSELDVVPNLAIGQMSFQLIPFFVFSDTTSTSGYMLPVPILRVETLKHREVHARGGDHNSRKKEKPCTKQQRSPQGQCQFLCSVVCVHGIPQRRDPPRRK